jgi:protein SCO1/2
MQRRWTWAAALALLACGLAAEETYQVNGVVLAVDASHKQIRIAHDEIPGFMPAMTMNFDVVSEPLIDGIEPGMQVSFKLERSATTLRITALDVIAGTAGTMPSAAEDPPPELDVAPDFELVDQYGARFSLAELRGSAVLLDFIFTRCPGPCPILTALHVDLQRRLPPPLFRRTHFVSISIDPEYDTPERLLAYGESRGANLENWSFLTGSSEAVQKVLKDYYIGTIRQDDGALDHLVVTLLIDAEGQVARRYLGLEHPPEKILADLEEILS